MSFDIIEYIEDKLDRPRPSAGNEWTAVCPNCGEYGGFYVNTETGAYVCFKGSCGFRGKTIVGLVAHVEDITWEEARAYLFRHSVTLRRRSTIFTLRDRVAALRLHRRPLGDDPVTEVELPPEMRLCYDGKKWNLPVYLKKRRIKAMTASEWGMGYCRVGRYAGRLIIPFECPSGSAFTARDMTGEQEPKYLNPAKIDFRHLLIGWHMARKTGELVVCEGPLDVVKLWQHNISAVALGGKELHDEQMSILMSLPDSTILYVMLDPEEVYAPLKVASKLHTYFTDVRLAKLPDGIDPGDSTRKIAHQALDSSKHWAGSRSIMLAARLRKSRESIAYRHGKKRVSLA